MAVTVDQAPPERARMPVRHVAAAVVGNALEFYDFLTYGYFAVYIGRTFFPTFGKSSLLLSLATFGVGFLTRPIGAIVIGSMGDRIGRKPAMLLSFTLMGVAIVGLALTPSYGRIGMAAPILVLLFRLLQGFALGGEVGPTTAYLVEAAPIHRRGFYSSMQYASQDTAVLAAGLVGTALASMLTAQELQDWGWRVAMLIGALIVPFGLLVRRGLPETLHAADDAALAPDATTGELSWSKKLRPYLSLIILGLMMLMSGTIASYVTSYMTTYALETLHMQATIAFGVIIVNGVFSVMFEPISGWLSDICGRKPVMLIPGFIMLLSILPCFWLISHFRTVLVFYTTMAWLSALIGLNTTPIVTVITESLPKSIRAGTLATVYAFAISIFGGSTQFTISWLIDVTKDPLAPAYYWSTALVIGLIAMALVKESAPLIRKPFDSA